jgi:hypothetical protein
MSIRVRITVFIRCVCVCVGRRRGGVDPWARRSPGPSVVRAHKRRTGGPGGASLHSRSVSAPVRTLRVDSASGRVWCIMPDQGASPQDEAQRGHE